MNKICKLSAIALLASSTSLMAQSKSFEGVSLGLSASAIGVEASGRTSNTRTSANGSIGKVAEIAAVDLSYGFTVGSNGLIQVGASYTPGKAKIGSGNFNDTSDPAVTTRSRDDDGSISLQVKDPYTIYIAPTYAISKDAAIYFKVGYSKADIETTASGSAALSAKPSDLEGMTYGIGSKTMLTPNFYLGVEANITDYDAVSATRAAVAQTGNEGVGTGAQAARTIRADVKTVQGVITVGYKF